MAVDAADLPNGGVENLIEGRNLVRLSPQFVLDAFRYHDGSVTGQDVKHPEPASTAKWRSGPVSKTKVGAVTKQISRVHLRAESGEAAGRRLRMCSATDQARAPG